MVRTNRKTKWAILLNKCYSLSVGDKILVKVISPWSGHGGSSLERSIETIRISSIKKVAPNMSLIKTNTTDYYMYTYDLSDKALCFPANNQWYASYAPELRNQIVLTRSIAKNDFKKEVYTTNPIFRIDVIHSSLAIAWCKDKSVGEDIGYVIESTSFADAPTGNYYWLWNTGVLTSMQEESCKITFDIAGEEVSTCIELIPKSATAIDDNTTIIEGKDGNFYIRLLPIDYCWQE